MKVVLIAPPSAFLLDQKALPHLGLLYIAASLKRFGHEVKILDFADGYRFEEADVQGVSTTTPQFPEALKVLSFLRERGAKRVVVGGPHASLMPEECLENGFDAVGVGDGELTMPVLINPHSPRVFSAWAQDIDDLPHPDRKALPLWNYTFEIRGLKATSMMTTRGCIWGKCVFCSRWDKNVRFHSPAYVQEEIHEIHELGWDALQIYDDAFFIFPKRDRQIVEALGRYGLVWRAMGRADYILRNKNLLEFAEKKGLAEVAIGIESGSNLILKVIEKGTTRQMNVEAIRFLHSLEIDVKANMVVMLPSESPETLAETWRFCELIEPYVSSWDFTVFVPYPGSAVYAYPESFDIEFDKNHVYEAYKGMGTSCWNPPKVKTSRLTFEDGMKWRDTLEARFKYKKNREMPLQF